MSSNLEEWVWETGLAPRLDPDLTETLAAVAHNIDTATRKAQTRPSWQTITALTEAHTDAARRLKQWQQTRQERHRNTWKTL